MVVFSDRFLGFGWRACGDHMPTRARMARNSHQVHARIRILNAILATPASSPAFLAAAAARTLRCRFSVPGP